MNYKIGIIGVGMIGLPLKIYFEKKGYKRGRDLFCYSRKNYKDDINKADIIFVCVPTPRSKDGSCDLSAVKSSIDLLSGNKIVVIKSTVTPTTVEKLQEKYPRHKFLFNPEFLTESQALSDFLNPDRQIVAHTSKSKDVASEVLLTLPIASFSSPGAIDTYNYVFIRATSAELGKYAGNVFGASKVVFGNFLYDVCEGINKAHSANNQDIVDYEEVRHVVSHDKRIGPYWLNVKHGNYRGFGGYCFVKDMDGFIYFNDSVMRKLSAQKNRTRGDAKKSIEELITRLKKGNAIFKAIRDYNATLLESQGLNIEKMSTHDKEIQKMLKKKKRKSKR